MGAASRNIPGLIVLGALLAGQLALRAQPQLTHLTLAPPDAMPEQVTDDNDFPFLSRLAGASLLKSTRVNEPLEVKPASADAEAMLAGMSFVEKSYSAPNTVSDTALVAIYRDALIAAGWRILDQPSTTAEESEPHVISLSAHYAANGRDLYTKISRTPDGSYAIDVADVGAEDWAALIDRTCRIPLFSVHFSRGLTLSYQESRSALEKLAALLRVKPAMKIEVQGHLDNIGTERELATLSTQRAGIVHLALVSLGVASNRLTAKGYGKSMPVAPNDTDWGRAKNRRIEILRLDCKSSRPGA